MATGGTVVSVLQSPMDGCQALFNFKATLSTRRTPVALRFGESRTPLQMCWTVRCRKRRPYSIAQLGVGVANLWEALTVHTAACVVVSAAALVSVVFLRCLRMSRAVVRPRWSWSASPARSAWRMRSAAHSLGNSGAPTFRTGLVPMGSRVPRIRLAQ
jgi:hypothetical protein